MSIHASIAAAEIFISKIVLRGQTQPQENTRAKEITETGREN
jgi:hypothetical protein